MIVALTDSCHHKVTVSSSGLPRTWSCFSLPPFPIASPSFLQAAICFFNDRSFPPLKLLRWAQCRSAWGYCVPFFSSRPYLPRKPRQPTLLSPLATPHNATTLRFPGLVNIPALLDYSCAWLRLMFSSRRNCAVYSNTYSCTCPNTSVLIVHAP